MQTDKDAALAVAALSEGLRRCRIKASKTPAVSE